MKGTALIAAALIMLAGAAGYVAWSSSPKQIAVQAVKARLRDPQSATFSGLETCYRDKNPIFVAGFVNSKNGYGGLTGNRGFLVVLDDIKDVSFEEHEGAPTLRSFLFLEEMQDGIGKSGSKQCWQHLEAARTRYQESSVTM